MTSTTNDKYDAASELLEEQEVEEADEAMVPVHDDAGPLGAQNLIGHDLDYIVKIPAHYEKERKTYFLPVGSSSGFRSPFLMAAKNSSQGEAS